MSRDTDRVEISKCYGWTEVHGKVLDTSQKNKQTQRYNATRPSALCMSDVCRMSVMRGRGQRAVFTIQIVTLAVNALHASSERGQITTPGKLLCWQKLCWQKQFNDSQQQTTLRVGCECTRNALDTTRYVHHLWCITPGVSFLVHHL